MNRYPRIARYFVNESSTLDRFPDGSVDFIYSDIVSQHLEPRAALVYIAEFMRLLTPRGVTVFRLPSHRRLGSDEIARPAAMAASAYRAGLTVVNGIPPTIGAGVSRVVMIDVQNRSDSTWDQTAVGAIRLGNHWRNERSDMIVQDDGRASLPTVVPPGTTERLSLTIRAPRDGGRFDCELDLVHEGISWFGDMGSTIVRLPVQITSDTSAAETASPRDELREPPRTFEYPDIHASLRADDTEIGPFPMFGVPRDVVLAAIQDGGGEVLFIEDDERGGPEWQGYRYYVAKR